MAETIVIGAGRDASLPPTGQTTIYQSGDDGDHKAGQDTPTTRFVDNGDGTIFDTYTNLHWPQQPELMAVGSAFSTGGQIGDDFGGGASSVRGAWADSTAYKKGDLVSDGGSQYICKADHTGDGAGNNDPTTDSTNWQITVWASINSDSVESWTEGADTVLTMTAHVFKVGELVTISGVTHSTGMTSAVNGTQVIKSVATNTITLETDTSGEGVPDAAAGTVNGAQATAGNWSDAITNCAALEYAGHSDWRLPNALEMINLVDYSRTVKPYIYSDLVFNYSDHVWTSTTRASVTTYAWRFVNGVFAQLDVNAKTASHLFVPVRGGIV